MSTFSLIIALVLDRSYEDLQGYRNFHWLSSYYRWLVEHWKIDQYGFWFAAGPLLLSILLLIALLDGLFKNALFGVFELAFNVAIAAVCLGPRSLDRDIDVYIDSLGDENSGQTARAATWPGVDAGNPKSDEAIDQLAFGVFVMGNRSLYSVIFWMVLAGPVGVVAYRLCERLAMQFDFSDKLDLQERATQLMGWMEWLPALLSSYAFMICGSFDAGLNRNRHLPVLGQNIADINHQRLHQVGMACSGVDTENNHLSAIDKIKKLRGLVLRSLVAWIVIAALVEFLA